jgi:FKBP-type peptidyl-prolyl cis-trans isomerase FklB
MTSSSFCSTSLFLLWTILLTSSSSSSSSSNPESTKFLQSNTLNPQITTLPSGLQYKILRTGLGQYHPEYNSPTECHYKGTLINGEVFDSSYDRGKAAVFQPRQVIKGWTEAMQLMVEGDKWELYIPSHLGYGDNGSPPKIKGGDALIFTMEMIEIKGTKVNDKKEVRCNITNGEKCTAKEIKYINSAKEKFSSGSNGDNNKIIEKEMERLKKISINGSDNVVDWCNRRIRILTQLKEKPTTTTLEENIEL